MRRLIAGSTMLALTAAGLVAAGPTANAGAAQRAERQPTAFALKSSGYGTRVRGGQLPAGSDSSAFSVIGCTNNAGVVHENHEAEETLPGVGTASEVKTRVWTTSRNGVVSSRSRDTIARITLADNPMGSLTIDGVKAVSRAYHDAQGFHAVTHSSVASITFTPTTGDPQSFDLPAEGAPPIDIPGVATIAAGTSKKHESGSGAVAVSEVLTITVPGSSSKVHVGHAYARIDGGIKSGIFGGFGAGSRGNAADGHVTSGRSPYQPMPCQGTAGKTRTKDLARADLGHQVVVSGLHAQQMTDATMTKAWGYEQGSVAKLNIGQGQLVVKGIVGKVHVVRKGAGLTQLVRNTRGTTIGSITANGQAQQFPDTGVLEIPGVAKLESNVKTKVRGGMAVTALRVTLLDGSGAVLNLGLAKLTILKSNR